MPDGDREAAASVLTVPHLGDVRRLAGAIGAGVTVLHASCGYGFRTGGPDRIPARRGRSNSLTRTDGWGVHSGRPPEIEVAKMPDIRYADSGGCCIAP